MTREEWLLAFADAARPHFEAAGAPIPDVVRCSIGFPSKGQRSKVVGECWSKDCTSDGVCEIFIRPQFHAGGVEIADTLTHELVHAAVGQAAGHGPEFGRPARALGLEGKLTGCSGLNSETWKGWALPILDAIGPYPGKEIIAIEISGGSKPQKNRQLKLECDTCGWTCRASQKMIDKVEHLCCPDYECGGQLEKK